ncbi:hypothetical protein ACFOD9_12220 [Novosphingobium bradum]|uniref:Uncharacterized protein n=1 Tax=Novosphingobium bradum TaxID=1737444 RepID=A0ABV7IUY0_9SPHN
MLADAWSDREIDLIVADYFAMLTDELADVPFNKAEHNRALQELTGRSKGSVEFKHQNISAVMLGLGQPWITGYKPAANFQNALVDGVLRWLEARADWWQPMARRRGLSVGEQGATLGHDRLGPDAPSLWIGPPPTQRNEPPPH